jgi:hypothetical protein
MTTPETLKVPLWSRGAIKAYALIDATDAHLVVPYRWSMDSGGRPSRWRKLGTGKRNGINVRMHREILGLTATDKIEVDHINCDQLDNRRSNMRLVTHPQNLQNRNPRGQSNGSSGVRGVSWDAATQKWRATVHYQDKQVSLGRHVSKEAAAQAVTEFRRERLPYSAGDQVTA